MDLTVAPEQDADERWIAEALELPGVHAYGKSRDEAIALAEALALCVLADRLEGGEDVPERVEIDGRRF